MRETYVIRGGKLVPKAAAEPLGHRGPYVISDDMSAMRHPITGKLMDSKSRFREITRAHGCQEVGNDVQRDTRRMTGMDTATRRADIQKAISELEN